MSHDASRSYKLSEIARLTGISYATLSIYSREYAAYLPKFGSPGRMKRYPAEAIPIFKAIRRSKELQRSDRLRKVKGKRLATFEAIQRITKGMIDRLKDLDSEMQRLRHRIGETQTEIERATPDDFYPLYLLGVKAAEMDVAEFPPFEPAELTHFLLSPEWVLHKATTGDGEIIGCIAAFAAPPFATIYYLLVSPEHRRSGIGTDLVERCLNDLRRRGVAKVGGFAGRSVQFFLALQGFSPLGAYVWMQKEILPSNGLAAEEAG
jgi:GNAT superfamily N-acetyltransferase